MFSLALLLLGKLMSLYYLLLEHILCMLYTSYDNHTTIFPLIVMLILLA